MSSVPDARPRVVAAFDFDGTLSTRDNVVPFLAELVGIDGTIKVLAKTGWTLGRAGRGSWNREQLKEVVVAKALNGSPMLSLERFADEYAKTIIAKHLRTEAVDLAKWHQEQGHEVVIVSASFAVYLRPVAEHLGLDAVLATELEIDDLGRLNGKLRGPNVRGPEKVRRLDEYLATTHGGEPAFVFAYGDSSGDKELWARADRAVRLGRRAHRGTS